MTFLQNSIGGVGEYAVFWNSSTLPDIPTACEKWGPLAQMFLIRAIRLGTAGMKLFLELGLQDQADS